MLLLSSCSAPASVAPPADGGALDARASDGIYVSQPIDLTPLTTRARLAFRAAGDGFAAIAEAHRAQIGPTGLSFETRETAPLLFGPTDIRMGPDAPLPTDAGPRVDDDGAVVIDRGGILERYENTDQGVEQSWRFARRPHALGDVVIHVPVEGPAYAGTDAEGLRFVDEPSGNAVRYTHATWIDADGSETPVPAVFASGRIVLTIPAELLGETSYPAVLDPTISSELALTLGAATWNAPGDQRNPAVAVGAMNTLVAWSDGRAWGVTPSIVVARVQDTGTILDSAGVRLGASRVGASYPQPSVAYLGGVYLVAWASGNRVELARIREDGAVLDATPIQVFSNTGSLRVFDAHVAASSTRFLVTWTSEDGIDTDVLAARVNTSGAVVDTTPITVTSDTVPQSDAAVASDGTHFLVTWTESSAAATDIHGVRVTSAGVVDAGGASAIAATATPERHARTAFDGSRYMVVWQATSTGGPIFGALVDTNGIPVAGATGQISRGTADMLPEIAFDGVSYRLSWLDRTAHRIYLESVPTTGPVIGTETVFAMDGVELPAIAARGSRIVIAWEGSDAASYGRDIRAQKVGTGGSWESMWRTISRSAQRRTEPAVAWNGSRFLVPWLQFDNTGAAQVYASRFELDGTNVDGIGRAVETRTDEKGELQVASVGGSWLVGWQDRRRIAVGTPQRDFWGGIFPNTSVPTVSARELQQSAVDTRLVAAGSTYELYYEYGTSQLSRRVIDASGIPGTTTLLVTSPAEQRLAVSPRLVAWNSLTSAPGVLDLLRGPTRLTLTNGVVPFYEIELAYSGTDHLLTWQSVRSTSSSPADVYAWVLDNNGNALTTEPTRFEEGLANTASPVVVFDSVNYFVAWAARGDLYALRITPTGTVIEPPVAISTESGIEAEVVMATDGRGRIMLVYHRFVDGPGRNEVDVRARIVDTLLSAGTDPIGAACVTSWGCASGHCIDGFCCDALCGGGASDCQACSAALGATANGRCTATPSGTVCRAASGPCDVQEICDGVGPACPADGVAAAGDLCGMLATGPCDLDDTCDGTSKSCSSAGRAPAGTVCGAALGVCDIEEVCDGTSTECPADMLMTAGTVCRDAADRCDAAERCDGASVACPVDGPSGAGTICRPAIGFCDEADVCDGVSSGCPPNALRAPGVVCRAATLPCDVEETCDGAGSACPDNAFVAAGVPCREPRGACDVEETCEGTWAGCPADAVATSAYVCRESSGLCDTPERCDGASNDCPVDQTSPDGASCDDGLACNGLRTCAAGACVDGERVGCERGMWCVEPAGECAPQPPRAASSGGCGCTVADPAPMRGMPLLLALVALVAIWLRRGRAA